jgi:hypothetical protein
MSRPSLFGVLDVENRDKAGAEQGPRRPSAANAAGSEGSIRVPTENHTARGRSPTRRAHSTIRTIARTSGNYISPGLGPWPRTVADAHASLVRWRKRSQTSHFRGDARFCPALQDKGHRKLEEWRVCPGILPVLGWLGKGVHLRSDV